MGEMIADKMGIPKKLFEANWKMFLGNGGPIRNTAMADYVGLDPVGACILFPGGRGTADMKQKALAKGLKVIEYKE
jgi:hypothetical protein